MLHAAPTRHPDAILSRALAALAGRLRLRGGATTSGARPDASATGRRTGPAVRPPRHARHDPADHVPPGSDWVWRPPLFDTPLPVAGQVGPTSGLALGTGVRLHHDCPLAEIAVRQLALPGVGADAFGLAVDVLHFRGSYLSVALSLPPGIARSLTRQHLIRLHGHLRLSTPTEVFLRLNLRHGPDIATITRQVPPGEDDLRLDFDLAGLDVDPVQVTGGWADVILSRPEMTRCDLRDLVLSRRLRAVL